MKSMTNRIDVILRVAEDNLTMVHGELKVELQADPDSRFLVHQLHKAMLEAHYAQVAWKKYIDLLSRRYTADANTG